MTLFLGNKFEEWRAQRKWDNNIPIEDDEFGFRRGFTYPDGSWIHLLYSRQWHTFVERSEFNDYDLNKVEKFLWDNHSESNYEN